MKLFAALLAAPLSFSLAGAALAEDLTFTLVNNTTEVLTQFHTSPVGVDSWEEDVFGEHVLAPGESVQLTIADGRDVCEYDMRFAFDGSEVLETTTDTQNLCELGTYTISQ